MRNKNDKFIFLLITLVFLLKIPVAFAHKETGLILETNGNLIGFPEKYLPANFDSKKLELRIGEKSVKFPKCITKYFNLNDGYDLKIMSAWDNLKSLDPYINFRISLMPDKFEYSLLFTLEDLKPIKFEIITHSEKYTLYHELKISESCLSSIRPKFD